MLGTKIRLIQILIMDRQAFREGTDLVKEIAVKKANYRANGTIELRSPAFCVPSRMLAGTTVVRARFYLPQFTSKGNGYGNTSCRIAINRLHRWRAGRMRRATIRMIGESRITDL